MKKFAVKIEAKKQIVYLYVEANKEEDIVPILEGNVVYCTYFQTSGTPEMEIEEITGNKYCFAIVRK